MTALRPPFLRSAGSEVWYSTSTDIHSPQILEYHGLRSIHFLANSLALIKYIYICVYMHIYIYIDISVYIHCFDGDIYIYILYGSIHISAVFYK